MEQSTRWSVDVLPRGQAQHLSVRAALGWYLPLGHIRQYTELRDSTLLFPRRPIMCVCTNCPRLHIGSSGVGAGVLIEQRGSLGDEERPAGQRRHERWPPRGWYLPAGHSEHGVSLAERGFTQNFPALQPSAAPSTSASRRRYQTDAEVEVSVRARSGTGKGCVGGGRLGARARVGAGTRRGGQLTCAQRRLIGELAALLVVHGHATCGARQAHLAHATPAVGLVLAVGAGLALGLPGERLVLA